MRNVLRRLRNPLGNALTWAAGWFIAAFPLPALAPFIFRPTPNFTFWGAVTFLAPTLAVIGFVSGGAFSLYLGIAGRDQRLNELKPGRVALGTGITVGLLMAVFLVLFVSLRGFPVSFGPAILAGSIFGGLGGLTALGQVKIAQKALPFGEEAPDELESALEPRLPDPEGEGV